MGTIGGRFDANPCKDSEANAVMIVRSTCEMPPCSNREIDSPRLRSRTYALSGEKGVEGGRRKKVVAKLDRSRSIPRNLAHVRRRPGAAPTRGGSPVPCTGFLVGMSRRRSEKLVREGAHR